MQVGSRVSTPDGVGTVKVIEAAISFNRYGILHDTYPTTRPIGLYLNNVLYYTKSELGLLTHS